MKSNQDSIDIYFNKESKEILYSLVHRKNPSGLATGDDDVFEPTISAVFLLWEDLLTRNIPDLYTEEWALLIEALESSATKHRLEATIDSARNRLVLALEDLLDGGTPIDSFTFAKKLAGFSDINILAIQWVVQKCLVAKSRGLTVELPEIAFKG
jgi:hypothetical protein